jgi:hypothetical protein
MLCSPAFTAKGPYAVSWSTALLTAGLVTLIAPTGHAQTMPAFAADFAEACGVDGRDVTADWRISANLSEALRPLRVRCVDDPGAPGKRRALHIEVHPGDAFDPNPEGNPSERVEIQLRRPVVQFDAPVWYSFGFRLVPPWIRFANRTVIQQIKQNIEPGEETDRGGACPSANPFFKIEAGGDPAGAAFVVKTRGTLDCRDGLAGVPVCGPWPLAVGAWHRVRVFLKASQRDSGSDLRVWLDGRACPVFTGKLGYLDHGKRDDAGRPVIDTQPRFGIYRDALPDLVQAIDFSDIVFWTTDPADDPRWRMAPTQSP